MTVDCRLSALASAWMAALMIRSAFAKTSLSIILPSTVTTAAPALINRVNHRPGPG